MIPPFKQTRMEDEMDNQQVRIDGKEVKRYRDYKILVSNDGTIYSLDGKVKKLHVHRSGYLRFWTKKDGKKETHPVHRVVAELFLPPPPDWLVEKCSKEHWGKVLVMHKDNNKFNNDYRNLQWGSLKDNTKQAFRDNLVQNSPGEKNGMAKLTNSEVHEICKYFSQGGSIEGAMIKYNISSFQSYSIFTRRNWKSISNQYIF